MTHVSHFLHFHLYHMNTERKSLVTEARQRKILQTAQEIFLKRGLVDAQMAEVASEVGIGRRTLYRYFPTKEQLALAVEIDLLDRLSEEIIRLFADISGTGFDKVTIVIKRSIELLTNQFREEVKFMGQFDNYFSKEYPSEVFSQKIKEINSKAISAMAAMIQEGVEDGSISKTIDPESVATTVSNMLLAMAQRIVIRGHHLKEEISITPESMLHQLSDLILIALKPTQRIP